MAEPIQNLMDCKRVTFSGHAVRRMFERGLSMAQIKAIIQEGEVIADYPDDKPYPSRLILGFSAAKPVHVVVARNEGLGDCVVVTAYVPDPSVWSSDFKTKRQS